SVPASCSPLLLNETEGLRIFDMALLCPLQFDIGHNQTSLRCLPRNHHTQMRPHATHHTPTACRRKVVGIVWSATRSFCPVRVHIAAFAAKRFYMSYNIGFGLE